MAKGTAPDFPGWAMVRYWDNVCSGIAWLAHQVSNRQEHLYIAQEIAAGRIVLEEPK